MHGTLELPVYRPLQIRVWHPYTVQPCVVYKHEVLEELLVRKSEAVIRWAQTSTNTKC
jgi:hypothetical protein